MSEENKTVELKDEELEEVVGGYTKNIDGTYNLKTGETICKSIGGFNCSFVILNDYQNITLNDLVYAEHCVEYADGGLHCDTEYYTLGFIFCNTGKEGLGSNDMLNF